ncbi:unnamed protein product [Blepharisma stoltei]|uniref:RING-type domain-containing protein n=1 Tax=Blepharisma stoltei TaxID=1481888 RepID=A0AAU9K302_9CILI|nr:unnamed protein product [Blepharisma stoltei]
MSRNPPRLEKVNGQLQAANLDDRKILDLLRNKVNEMKEMLRDRDIKISNLQSNLAEIAKLWKLERDELNKLRSIEEQAIMYKNHIGLVETKMNEEILKRDMEIQKLQELRIQGFDEEKKEIEIANLQAKIQENNEIIEKAKISKNQIKQKVEEKEKVIKKLEGDIINRNSYIEELEKKIKIIESASGQESNDFRRLNKELKKLAHENSVLKSEKEKIAEEKFSLQNELQSVKEIQSKAKHSLENNEYMIENEQLKSKIKELQDKIEEHIFEKEKSECISKEILKKTEAQDTQISDLESENSKITEENINLNKYLDQAKSKSLALESENLRLCSEISQLTEISSKYTNGWNSELNKIKDDYNAIINDLEEKVKFYEKVNKDLQESCQQYQGEAQRFCSKLKNTEEALEQSVRIKDSMKKFNNAIDMIERSILCMSCLEPLSEAKIIIPCGHFLCRFCKKSQCVECLTTVEATIPTNFFIQLCERVNYSKTLIYELSGITR